VYLSFFSMKGCTVKIIPKYPKDEEDDDGKKKS
jgi:hypothetical protein